MEWDVQNPVHRRILEAARAWGVSPSRFMGAEPAVVAHNENGGTFYTREPEWLESDRFAAVELLNYEAELCPGCKTPMSETTSEDNEYAYKAGLPVRCHRCTAVSVIGEAYSDHPHSSALFFPVELREKGNEDAGNRIDAHSE